LLQAVLIDGVHGNLLGARDCAHGGYRACRWRCCLCCCKISNLGTSCFIAAQRLTATRRKWCIWETW
jgi:hypothetical protein